MPLPNLNKHKVTEAIRMLIEAVGENPDEGHFVDTPARVANMLDRILDGNFVELGNKEATSFNNDSEYTGIVMVHHVPFYSFCAHHLLPFFGHFAIGYLPGETILGLSKLVRIFRHACKIPTTQEDITQGAVARVEAVLNHEEAKQVCRGVICHVSATHSCMTMRGVQAHGSLTTTIAYSGEFETNVELRNQFLAEATKARVQ